MAVPNVNPSSDKASPARDPCQQHPQAHDRSNTSPIVLGTSSGILRTKIGGALENGHLRLRGGSGGDFQWDDPQGDGGVPRERKGKVEHTKTRHTDADAKDGGKVPYTREDGGAEAPMEHDGEFKEPALPPEFKSTAFNADDHDVEESDSGDSSDVLEDGEEISFELDPRSKATWVYDPERHNDSIVTEPLYMDAEIDFIGRSLEGELEMEGRNLEKLELVGREAMHPTPYVSESGQLHPMWGDLAEQLDEYNIPLPREDDVEGVLGSIPEVHMDVEGFTEEHPEAKRYLLDFTNMTGGAPKRLGSNQMGPKMQISNKTMEELQWDLRNVTVWWHRTRKLLLHEWLDTLKADKLERAEDKRRTLVLHEMNGQTKHSSDSDSEDVSEEIDNCMALVQRMINDCEERERIGLKYL
eukprot:CAMPEP_0184318394 /NCGR_PEP_ID=MMETSP1049-20130417/102383_1 /TAXON_ID=77928 /ORGANISM="Proteomonas sulcata, Strain CCMP704" /LENGTH=412 /DNA_ID=CAMNT_0026638145 /DNA_START=1 /DNA_END=1239 /DNA_ORIENTATION=+